MPARSAEPITNAPADTALLAAWAERGDELAFAALVERHLPLVQGVARRRLEDDLAARDVVQTVFAILARKAATLKNVRVLAAWLHRVAAAQSARAIRQLVRDRRLRDSAMQHVTLTSTGRDPFADALPLLDAALDSLPERDRALLLLRYSEGVSFAEAAARLGRSETALRQQASRAVEKLSACLRRRGVVVPAAVLSGGMATAVGGGGAALRAAEVARAALASAPAVSGGTLFFTSLLTMSTLKFSLIAAGVVLLLTGVPAVWQSRELTRLRAAAAATSMPVAATSHSAAATVVAPSAVAAKKAGPSSAVKAPATLDMEAIGKAVEGSMKELMTEGVRRWAGIEARRAALALGLSPQAEQALRERIAQLMEHDMKHDAPADGAENFQQRTRQAIEEHLAAAAAPEQVERWRSLRRQREETEIEKVAANAFHSTARLVDLTAQQKDSLFKQCSEAARELYATHWKNSVSAGAAIAPHPAEPLEKDETLLREVLTPEQLADWQTLSASQREYYDALPRRVMGRVFSVVSGEVLAEAIRKDLPAADSKPTPP